MDSCGYAFFGDPEALGEDGGGLVPLRICDDRSGRLLCKLYPKRVIYVYNRELVLLIARPEELGEELLLGVVVILYCPVIIEMVLRQVSKQRGVEVALLHPLPVDGM